MTLSAALSLMAELTFLKQSELSRPLERFRRNNIDSAPRFAHVAKQANDQWIVFQQERKIVIDVLAWTVTERVARATARAQQKFYDMEGLPAGRKAIIVKLGE